MGATEPAQAERQAEFIMLSAGLGFDEWLDQFLGSAVTHKGVTSTLPLASSRSPMLLKLPPHWRRSMLLSGSSL